MTKPKNETRAEELAQQYLQPSATLMKELGLKRVAAEQPRDAARPAQAPSRKEHTSHGRRSAIGAIRARLGYA